MPDYFPGAVAPAPGIGGTGALGERVDKAADLATLNLGMTVPQFNSAGAKRVVHDGGVPLYYGNSQFTCDSTATDIFVLAGVASKTIKVEKIKFSSVATGAASGRVQVLRRSTADTAGTAVASGIGYASKDDQAAGTPNAVAAPQHYTAHPTALGTAAGVIHSQQYQQVAVNGAVQSVELNFRTAGSGKALRLSGTTDILALNVAAALGGAGNIWDVTVEWTEEPTTA